MQYFKVIKFAIEIPDFIDTTSFISKPSIEEIEKYIEEQHYSVNAEKFYSYYESNGWKIGKSSMKSWKAALRTWNLNNKEQNKSILSLLLKNGKKTVESYLTHMKYAMAFRGVIPNKEEVDAIFVEIKSKMQQLNLKSKDMKKFIEYGWLTSIDGFFELENYKYNFRDGVERLAGLNHYSKTYELASEIAHSSPLLIYSKSQYFYHATLINLMESFFRIEEMFLHFYKVSSSEEEFNRYLNMRQVYIAQIKIIYKIETTIMKK